MMERKKSALTKEHANSFGLSDLINSMDSNSDSDGTFDENGNNPSASADLLKTILAEGDSDSEFSSPDSFSRKHSPPLSKSPSTSSPVVPQPDDRSLLAEILKESGPARKKSSQPPVKPADPLEVVEKYENASLLKEEPVRHIQYLAESMVFTPVVVNRMNYETWEEIGRKLGDTSNGRPTCVRAFGNFIYVGTSLGVIKVFDGNEREHKVLASREMQNCKVTCMDISKNGSYLAAGFVNGKVVLYDLVRNAAICIVANVHDRTVLNIRFLKGPKLWIVSSDVCGYVFLTEFSKAVFGLSGNSVLLLNNRVAFALAPLYEYSLYHNSADQMNMVAIGGVNSVIIAILEPEPKVLWEFKRRLPVRKGIPYIDWGRGILPGKPEDDNLILAIAWDKVIQLVEIFGDSAATKGYAFNGYYESEYEIQSIWWAAESVLLVLTSRNEIKILHSERFVPGEYNSFEYSSKPLEKSAPELEKPYKIADELCMQVYSIGRGKSESEPQMRNSYHQTFVIKNHEVIGLGKTGIIHGKLFTWNEYLDRQRGRSQWIDALRVSLEIYLGTLKGFAELSEDRNLREAAMRAFMKNFIQECLLAHLEKAETTTSETQAANVTQIQVTIEFCIGISAYEYLFGELLALFAECGLEGTFIESLEPYILSSKFRSVPAPQELVAKLITHYLKGGKVGMLEKVLLFLSLERVDLDFLSNVCVTNKMFSALIYVKSLQGHDYQYMEPALYMHNEMMALKKTRKVSNPDDTEPPLSKMLVSSSGSGTSLNKSYTYLGYKILWYIKKCFKGEKFPKRPNIGLEDSKIPMKSWPSIVYVLLKWMLIEHQKVTNLQELMELDVKTVFAVLGVLFEEPTLRRFLTDHQSFSSKDCQGIGYGELLGKLAAVSESANSSVTASLHYYHLFLAQVSSQPGTTISPDLCIATARFLIKGLSGGSQNKEEIEKLILGMTKNCPDLGPDRIETLLKFSREANFTEVEVYLTELKGDYLRCFEIYFSLKDWARAEKIFDWLFRVKDSVTEANANYSLIQKLISELLEKMVGLLFIFTSDCKGNDPPIDEIGRQKNSGSC